MFQFFSISLSKKNKKNEKKFVMSIFCAKFAS